MYLQNQARRLFVFYMLHHKQKAELNNKPKIFANLVLHK